VLQHRSRRWAGGSGASSAPEAPATRFAAATSRSCRPVGPPGQHPSTSRPGDPHWFRSSSSNGTVKGGQAAPPRRDLSHLARDEQACGRAILRKRSTVGFHSAGGQVHAGAVGHRRRAGRCAMQPLPWAEERSPAPQPHTLCGDPAVGPPCSQPRRRRNWQHDCETALAGRFTGRTAPHHRRCGAVSEHQHEQKEEASASSLMLLPNSYWREDNQGT